MFKTVLCKQTIDITLPKNLLTLLSAETKKEMESMIDQLQMVATDPYANSLTLLASSLLGDRVRFATALSLITDQVKDCDDSKNTWLDDPKKVWMKGHSFKAWMLGRMVKAAYHIGDDHLMERQSYYLSQALQKTDNVVFNAWALGYRAFAADRSIDAAIDASKDLITKYQELLGADRKLVQSALSDALWACVLNLLGAAKTQRSSEYSTIKEMIRSLIDYSKIAKANTSKLGAALEEMTAPEEKCLIANRPIGKGLVESLLRTSESNDYPAWAIAAVRLAASLMGDIDLFEETESIIKDSIADAKKGRHDAEYVLAFLENSLADENWKVLANNSAYRKSRP